MGRLARYTQGVYPGDGNIHPGGINGAVRLTPQRSRCAHERWGDHRRRPAAGALRAARGARRPPRRGGRARARTVGAHRRGGRDRQVGARAGVLRGHPRQPGAAGRVRRAVHPAPARAVRGHRRRGRRRAGRGRRAGRRAGRPGRGAATRIARRPSGLVALEDLHWADEATLDVLRLLGRRIESLPALVLATYRDDEIDRTHPAADRARRAAGRLGAAASRWRRCRRRPCAQLAGPLGVDRASCTAGRPATRSS